MFYAGRAVCFQGQQQFTQWDACRRRRPRLRPDPRLRPARRGHVRPERQPGSRRSPTSRCCGAKGGGTETGTDVQDRARHPRHRPGPGLRRRRRDPELHLRRRTTRTTGGTMGRTRPARCTGPGLRPRRLHGRASPVALHVQRRRPRRSRRLGADRPPLHDAGLLLLPPRRLDGLRLGRATCTSPPATTRATPRTRPTAATPTRTRRPRCRARVTPTSSRTRAPAAASTRPTRTAPARSRRDNRVRRRY